MLNGICRGLLVLFLLLIPATARAQTPLSEILVQLLLKDIVLAPGNIHSHHFVSGETQQEAAFIFNQEIVAQLATFPSGSSSGGFSFTRDPKLGTYSRNSDSFGPSFSERALTSGKGWVGFGMNFQYTKYDTFNSLDLENGDVKFYLRHAPDGGAFYEGDLIQANLNLKLSTNTTSFFFNYGLTDRLDVSVIVPLVHANLDASVDATVIPLATGTAPIHRFSNGTTQSSFAERGSATGIGDLLIRGKYRLWAQPGGGIALEVDGRMPTGDASNLLGTGTAQGTFMGIWSAEYGKFAPHFNASYTVSGESDVEVIGQVPDEFGYRGGAEYVVNPRFTLSGDVVGRMLLDANQLALGSTTVNYTNAFGTPGSTTFTEFHSKTGNLNIVFAAIGTKINVTGNLLITANVLLPINWTGIRAKVTPVFGFEYSFGPKK